MAREELIFFKEIEFWCTQGVLREPHRSEVGNEDNVDIMGNTSWDYIIMMNNAHTCVHDMYVMNFFCVFFYAYM